MENQNIIGDKASSTEREIQLQKEIDQMKSEFAEQKRIMEQK